MSPFVLVTLLAGCGAAPKAPPVVPTAAAPPCPAAPTPVLAVAPQESLLERVPASAVAAVVIRRGSLGLVHGLLDGAPAMKKELSAYLTSELGVDPTGIEGAVAWSSSIGARRGAVFVRLREAGTLKGRRAGQHRGVDLVEVEPLVVAASVPGGLLIGSPSEVAAGIDLAGGHAASLAGKTALSFMADSRARDADLLCGVYLPAAVGPDLRGAVQAMGVRAALLSYTRDGLVTLRVLGDAERLSALQKLLKSGFGLVSAELERAKDKAVRQRNVVEAVGAIVGYHQAQKLYQEVEPHLEGGALVSQYRLPQLAMSETFFVIGGMAAAIAIPTFIKYVRRSKAAEARSNLRRIAMGARAYHELQQKKGRRFAFPASTPWSPAAGCCATGGKCAPVAATWNLPTWRALGFAVTDTHYYQYRFTSAGKGARASFVVEARGDLNCDGTYSSFRQRGHFAAGGALEVKPLEVEHETE